MIDIRYMRGERRVAACAALAAGSALLCGALVQAQNIKIPDLRGEPALTAPAPKPGDSCGNCGIIRSIREIQIQRPVPVPGAFQNNTVDPQPGSTMFVGAVAVLPLGSGSGKAYVGGVGTPEMRSRFQDTSYEITVRLDNGGYSSVQRSDGAQYQVGDRVRVEGIQLYLLVP